MENVRVRRAGYANRQTYEHFLDRYKMLCKQTWPNFTYGNAHFLKRCHETSLLLHCVSTMTTLLARHTYDALTRLLLAPRNLHFFHHHHRNRCCCRISAGTTKQGVKLILQAFDLRLAPSDNHDVAMGNTKLFIRQPRTLALLEKARSDKIPELVIMVQVKQVEWQIFCFGAGVWLCVCMCVCVSVCLSLCLSAFCILCMH